MPIRSYIFEFRFGAVYLILSDLIHGECIDFFRGRDNDQVLEFNYFLFVIMLVIAPIDNAITMGTRQ